jgi:outer membrane receptor protein involved in Fe transport
MLRFDAYLRGTRDLLVASDAFQEKDDIEGPGISVGALLGQFTAGEKRSAGAELNGEYNWGPWNARLGLGMGRTFVRAPGRLQSGLRWRPSDLDVPVSLQGALSWEGSAWTASLAMEWRSGYPISAPVARYQMGDPVEEQPLTYLYRPQVNNERLDPYFRMDFTLGYSFPLLSADWTAELTLFNVTNRGNELSRTYEPRDVGINVSSQRGLPLLPLLEFEMEL